MVDFLADERMPGDSELERRMMQLLTAYHLPRATLHPIVIGYEIDFVIDGSIILLECDGWETHGLNRDQFEFDRIRRADLTAAGYVVVHFTWRRVTTAPDRVAADIRAAVLQWAPHLLVDG